MHCELYRSLSLAFLLGCSVLQRNTVGAFSLPASTRRDAFLQRSNISYSRNEKESTSHKCSNSHEEIDANIIRDMTAKASTSIISMVLIFSTVFNGGGNVVDFQATSPSTFLRPPDSSAAVAPLADVGLREFLVKDGKEFLRLGLPTSLPAAEDPEKLGDTGRTVQEAIELVRLRLEQVGFSGKGPVWNASLKEVNKAKSLISTPDMVKGITSKGDQKKAAELVDQAQVKLDALAIAVRGQDISGTLSLQEEVGALVGEVRSLSLPPGQLPYAIPSEYGNLPQLRGRATVVCTLQRGPKSKQPFVQPDGTKTTETKMTLVIDGYHSPITSGNFVDLVKRKFYDGMPVQSVGDIIVKSGKPTKEDAAPRRIPLEIFYKKDKAPTYGYTSDDDLRATESFVMPFQAYGALGMDYNIEDEDGVNSGSSEFWFLKWDQALVAPSRNTLDGSHSCFGYVVEGGDILDQVKEGDIIQSMQVTKGGENFFSKK